MGVGGRGGVRGGSSSSSSSSSSSGSIGSTSSGSTCSSSSSGSAGGTGTGSLTGLTVFGLFFAPGGLHRPLLACGVSSVVAAMAASVPLIATGIVSPAGTSAIGIYIQIRNIAVR